jgi:hypothetical protein
LISASSHIQALAPNSTAIVYGVYINADADWRRLIRLQLNDLRRSGVLSVADLHVVISNPSREEGVTAFFDALPIKIANIELFDENKFEYPAISYIWSLANNRPDYEYIAYLHTKGMSYAKRRRDKIERALTFFTFSKWSEIRRIFDTRDNIHKIGLFPACQKDRDRIGEWIWFNFWWARSSFIRALPKPEVSKDRYYYESWLGLSRPANDCAKGHCYSIFRHDVAYFTPDEAGNFIRLLHWKLKYRQFYKVRSGWATFRKRWSR